MSDIRQAYCATVIADKSQNNINTNVIIKEEYDIKCEDSEYEKYREEFESAAQDNGQWRISLVCLIFLWIFELNITLRARFSMPD